MINTIDEKATRVLHALYNKLGESLLFEKKKLIGDSIFLTLLKLSTNDTYRIIHNSSMKFENAFRYEINSLERMKFVRMADDKERLDEIVITTNGIWYIESSRNIIDLEKILEYVQVTKLEFPKTKQVFNDNEKVIIYSMLAVRTFSENVTMDLTSTELCREWQNIIENSVIPYLRERELIKLKSIIDKKTGNEDPISYLMRRANDLPQKTNNLFIPTKKNRYYLSMNIDDKGKCISQLSFLLMKIFPELKSDQIKSEIYDSLCSVAHNQSLYVASSFDFINNHWDKIIDESLEKIYLGLDIPLL